MNSIALIKSRIGGYSTTATKVSTHAGYCVYEATTEDTITYKTGSREVVELLVNTTSEHIIIKAQAQTEKPVDQVSVKEKVDDTPKVTAVSEATAKITPVVDEDVNLLWLGHETTEAAAQEDFEIDDTWLYGIDDIDEHISTGTWNYTKYTLSKPVFKVREPKFKANSITVKVCAPKFGFGRAKLVASPKFKKSDAPIVATRKLEPEKSERPVLDIHREIAKALEELGAQPMGVLAYTIYRVTGVEVCTQAVIRACKENPAYKVYGSIVQLA